MRLSTVKKPRIHSRFSAGKQAISSWSVRGMFRLSWANNGWKWLSYGGGKDYSKETVSVPHK